MNRLLCTVAIATLLGTAVAAEAPPGGGGFQRGAGPGGSTGGGPGGFQRGGDPVAAEEARLDAVKRRLNLAPEQEGPWERFAAAMKAQSEAMAAARRSNPPPSVATAYSARLDERIARLSSQLEQLKAVAAAAKPLEAALTEQQRQILDHSFGPPGRGSFGPGRSGGGGGPAMGGDGSPRGGYSRDGGWQ